MMINSRQYGALGVGCWAFALMASGAFAQEPKTEIRGTIVSVRGNILQIRPNLRPKLTRASFGDKTEVLSFRRADKDILKPGMRIEAGGPMSKANGFAPFFLVGSTERIGQFRDKATGFKTEDGGNEGWAQGMAIVKTVDPLTFTDEDGKELPVKTNNLRRYFEIYRGDRNTLLIGTRMQLTGVAAPDGVIQAETISVDKDYAAVGTMFGTIVSVNGKTVKVRPRYTQETIDVTMTDKCVLQKELPVDPDSIKPGRVVTFWGQRGKDPGNQDRLMPVALLVGEGRYPAATEGDEAASYLTGKITGLDPVRFELPDKTTLTVIVPAQMATAALIPQRPADLKPGSPAMFVLRRDGAEKFTTDNIVVDASPFVGYGG